MRLPREEMQITTILRGLQHFPHLRLIYLLQKSRTNLRWEDSIFK